MFVSNKGGGVYDQNPRAVFVRLLKFKVVWSGHEKRLRPLCKPDLGMLTQFQGLQNEIIIDREAREIIRSVASIRLSVSLSPL